MGVTGIGGFFFRAQDPKALAAWYATHLGVGGGDWGLWQQEAGPSVFSPAAVDSKDFAADRPWMLNFRVTGIDDLIAGLRAAGADVETKAEWDAAGIGRFARLRDPEGNPVELWEAAEANADAGIPSDAPPL